MSGKKAIIAGASGLIGSNLLQVLLDSEAYAEVLILVRKPLAVHHQKLKQIVLNFDDLDKHATGISGHALFCCLGTTRSQTPDKTEYRKIDHDYPVKLAQLAHKNNVKQCHLISCIGADSKSSNGYLKLKGETEDDVKAVGLPALHIYQPSMLIGRKTKLRWDESLINGLMAAVNPLLVGGLKKYRSIPAIDIARAMLIQSIDNETGIMIHQYEDIKQNT